MPNPHESTTLSLKALATLTFQMFVGRGTSKGSAANPLLGLLRSSHPFCFDAVLLKWQRSGMSPKTAEVTFSEACSKVFLRQGPYE